MRKLQSVRTYLQKVEGLLASRKLSISLLNKLKARKLRFIPMVNVIH